MNMITPFAAASRRRTLGRSLGIVIVLGALLSGWAVIHQVTTLPQTDDAEVFANLIGLAPEVNGRIVVIHVADNQAVKQGDLLFEIDPRPYEYALETARSEQAALEGRIADLQRTIAAQGSAVRSAQAIARSAEAKISSADAAVEAAKAAMDAARSEVTRAEADYAYAENSVLRLEPLLAKQFVTVDQVDQARTSRAARGEAVRQARARLALAQAQWTSAVAQQKEAEAGQDQTRAQLQQSMNSVTLVEPLVAQRQARAAAVKNAEYDLARCQVKAPFDGRVTNLTISEGAYAHSGQPAFTLIDTRTWWVIANFRETELQRIRPGMHADVYLMSQPHQRFDGVVDSLAFGVTPDPSLVGTSSQSLPDVQRSLNWVHLATRFPVRVRVTSTSPDTLRLGTSAIVVLTDTAHRTGADDRW
jgi:multidrug efflux system membrane fusion protein